MKFLFPILLLLTSCEQLKTKPLRGCKLDEKYEFKTVYGSFLGRRDGYIIEESHLATSEDYFKGEMFPSHQRDRVDEHIKRSCEQIGQMYPVNFCLSSMYRYSHRSVWTPAEGGGKIGQGAVGERRPLPIHEIFSCNMYFKKIPKEGERFIVTFKEKSLVVDMSYEIGPAKGRMNLIGGCRPEVFMLLGIERNPEIVSFTRPLDQGLNLGPIDCKE